MNLKNLLGAKISVALTLLLLLAVTCSAVVCRLSGIVGFESELSAAKRVIGSGTTSDTSKIKVFLTQKQTTNGTYLYAHSNFVSEGAENPTKLAVREGDLENLRELLGNLVYTNAYDFQQDTLNTSEAIKKNIKFFADEAFFDASGKPALDLSGVSFLNFVEKSGNTARLYPTGSPRPPPFAAALTKNLRTKFRPGTSPAALLKKLESAKFSKDNLSFINLIEETSVETTLAGSDLVKHAISTKKPPTEEGIFETIRANHGKTLTALFHSDGINMIIEDSSGSSILKIPLAKIAKVAQEANCALIGLGCKSGHAEVAIGSLESFNPVDAVTSVNRGLGASSFAEFAELITGDKFHLVFDEQLLQRVLTFETQSAALDIAPIAGAARPSFVGVFVLPRQLAASSAVVSTGSSQHSTSAQSAKIDKGENEHADASDPTSSPIEEERNGGGWLILLAVVLTCVILASRKKFT